MSNIGKNISIEYPDGNIHQVYIYQVDRTKDGKIIISYWDFSKNMAEFHSEIVLVDGEYKRLIDDYNWDNYEQIFCPFDPEYSNEILSSLNSIIKIYNPNLDLINDNDSKDLVYR